MFNRRNPYSIPTANQLNQGLHGLRRVNVMDHLQTQLPPLTRAQILHMAGGPHSPAHARKYMTGYRERQVLEDIGPGGQYQDPDSWHQASSIMLNNLVGYIFEQANRPPNWNDARYGAFEPSRLLLVPNIQVKS